MSIFSINDNSNYNSILSQAKANKESKENSKISFANSFIKPLYKSKSFDT
ncbi:hypothetical protein ACM2H3_001281 [Campylobacter jejuni]